MEKCLGYDIFESLSQFVYSRIQQAKAGSKSSWMATDKDSIKQSNVITAGSLGGLPVAIATVTVEFVMMSTHQVNVMTKTRSGSSLPSTHIESIPH